MMPNNQWWFNTGNVSPTVSNLYYLRKVSETNIFPPMDGVELIDYNGNLKMMFGWNPALSGHALLPFPATPDSNYIFDTTTEGRESNWTQNVDSSCVATHGQGRGVRLDGKIWHWGIGGEVNPTDSFVWTYDTVNGWVQVSANWTLGIRISHKSFLHNDYLYTFGGQDNINIASPTAYDTMYRSNDGITWSLVSNLPTPFMTASTVWHDNSNNIYISGGGELSNDPNGYNNLVTNIYKSTDHGFTWNTYAALPSAQQGIWANAYVWDNKVWWLNGYKNGVNQAGLYYSSNWGTSWTLFSTLMPARHLTGMEVSNNHLHMVCGNMYNDHWRVETITYPFTLDPDVQTWYEKLYPVDRPGTALLTDINDFVIGCKADLSLNGITSNWVEADVIHLLSGMDNEYQVLQPLKTSNTAFINEFRKVNSPTIDFNGVTGNGSVTPTLASGLGLRWTNNTHSDKFTNTFASLWAYSLSILIEDTNDFGNGRNVLDFCQTNNRFYASVNDASEASVVAVNGKGYRGATRFDATNREIILNGVHTASTQAEATANNEFSICGILSGLNSLVGASAKTYGALGMGSGDIDHDKMQTRIETYFTARGVSF